MAARTSSKTRIAIVDDHPLTRRGIRYALESGGFEVVGEGASAKDAIELCQELDPAIILLDINMPGDGLKAAADIGKKFSNVKALMLTVYDNLANVKASLKAGAAGYVLKGVDSDELVDIVRDVSKGRKHVSPELAAKVLLEPDGDAKQTKRASPGSEELTKTERNILDLLARGATNREIGASLNLTETTIKQYTSRLFKKLGVKNRTEAALLFHK